MRKSLLVLIILLVSFFHQVSCEAKIITEENKVWGNRSFRVEKVPQDRSGAETSVKETITFEKSNESAGILVRGIMLLKFSL